MNALVIDDSRAMRRILRTFANEIGFEVAEAENGQEGLSHVESSDGDLDLVLVDWNMPVMNGYEFVKAVRAQSKFADIKVVMVTTETEPVRMAQALMAGADEFVMKPFTKDVLIEKLRLIGVKTLQSQ